MAITVTDMRGATIPNVHVEMSGPTNRMGETDTSGQLSFPGLQAGTYRLRFSGEPVTAFEREVTLRAGQVADLDITLSAAPPKPEAPAPVPPPPVAAVAPPVGPAGQPQVLSIVDMLERDMINGNQPRKDTLVSCSGNTRSMLVQLNQPQAQRVYDGAEAMYYVVAGEGTATIAGKDSPLVAGGYVSVPRDTPHSLTRRGRRPLIMLAILSGEPCEMAK
jgi:mannose-6-phosphate isomerase-like protein (cupin superfamily)